MILLLNPPNPKGTVSNKDMMGGFGQLYPAGVPVKVPPLDMVYAAALLKKSGVDFEVIDCLGLELDAAFLKEKLSGKKYAYVFIRTSTATLSFDLAIAALVKEVCLCKTVFFGPQTGIDSLSILKNPAVDALITGEPEEAVKLVAVSGFKDVKGVLYKDDGEFVKNGASAPIILLDALPFPAWEYFPYEKYNIGNLLEGEGNTSFVLTSRGCPFDCNYCPYPVAQGTVYRKRTAVNVVEEIKYLYKKFAIRKILFRDAEFTLDRQKVLDICAGIKELKLKWRCETRIDTLDEALIEKMAKAGCTGINMGIESGCDRIITASGRKSIDKEQTVKIMERCRELGINTFCFFIIGLPGDDLSSITETMEFAEKLNADISQFTVATPYPGTRLHAWAEKKKYIEKYSDDMITGYEALMRNENLTAEQIRVIRNAAQERLDNLGKIKEQNNIELNEHRMAVGLCFSLFLKKGKKKAVVYGASGLNLKKIEAKGYEIVGVVDEKYFGEKVRGFTVFPTAVISVLHPEVVIISHLKRSVNILQYADNIEILEPLALIIMIGRKLKNIFKKKAARI